MDSDQFWTLVDRTRERAPESIDDQTEALRAELSSLSADDLLTFDEHYTRASHALYTWEIWRAADIMIGDASEDVFADFRSWVISRGRAAYEAVLASPDHGLAALDVDDDDEAGNGELFGAVVHEVYEDLTGVELAEAFPDRPSADFPDGEPAGYDVGGNRKERRAHFPELAAKHPTRGRIRFPWRS